MNGDGGFLSKPQELEDAFLESENQELVEIFTRLLQNLLGRKEIRYETRIHILEAIYNFKFVGDDTLAFCRYNVLWDNRFPFPFLRSIASWQEILSEEFDKRSQEWNPLKTGKKYSDLSVEERVSSAYSIIVCFGEKFSL